MAKLELEQLQEYVANFHKEKSRLAMARREAFKVWQADDRSVRLGNEAMMKVCVCVYVCVFVCVCFCVMPDVFACKAICS